MKRSDIFICLLTSLLAAMQPMLTLAADGDGRIAPQIQDDPASLRGSDSSKSDARLNEPAASGPKYNDAAGSASLIAPTHIVLPPVGGALPTLHNAGEGKTSPPSNAVSPAENDTVPPSALRGQIPVPPGGRDVTPETAKEAIDTDFSKHESNTAGIKKGQPEAKPSGASDDRSPAILTNQRPSGPGPSIAHADTDRLDQIQLTRPPIESLITVNNYLNPFQLDATTSSALNLRQALLIGLDQNLDLAISRTNSKQQQFGFYSAMGNFLPDPTLGFSEYFPDGRIGLPISPATLLGGASSSAAGTSAAGLMTTSNNTTIRIRRPFEIMHAGMEFYAYRGGSVLFGALQAKHNYKAAKLQEKASLRDVLMTITQNYYNQLLAETLLQIRIQAVRTSTEQLRRNLDRFHSGLATNLDVLQSRTQLSKDRQALVDQQTNRRASSITLSQSLYTNLGQDLIPVELNVRKVRLVDPRLNIADLLQLAIDNRPELKQYEELRLAAKRAIMVAAANLQPSVLLSGAEYGIGPPSNVQALGLFSVIANWRLRGAGTVDAFNVQQARWQARQARLNSQKELQLVLSQVRNSYLQILDKERNIDESTDEVQSSLEELRLAELRKSSGLGINLDIITAQRDYTQALVDKAQAIIQFNIAQAQLVHDMGLVSVDALTSGRLLSKSNKN